jgi:hypothetical protein
VNIVAHQSRDASAQNWKAFDSDPDWINVKAASEKDGPPVNKYDSLFMDALPFSPMK